MKKLHAIAFYALTAPVITLGAGSLLAQPAADRDTERAQQRTQSEEGAPRSSPLVTEGEQNTRRAGQPAAPTAANNRAIPAQAQVMNRGYLASAPPNGMHSSYLIGASVQTTGGEDVGPVEDLVIDKDGQIVAIVVGVGGFLGLGEKRVAIGWDDVTMSGRADEMELRIASTREALTSAPEFEEQD